LPLPPIGSESSSVSILAASQPQIKIEVDDESQTFRMAGVNQSLIKRQKLQCKQFEDIIMDVELSDFGTKFVKTSVSTAK